MRMMGLFLDLMWIYWGGRRGRRSHLKEALSDFGVGRRKWRLWRGTRVYALGSQAELCQLRCLGLRNGPYVLEERYLSWIEDEAQQAWR